MNSEKELIEYIKKHYIYRPLTGEICNRKWRVLKGYRRGGYKRLTFRIGKRRCGIDMHRVAWVLAYGRFPKQIDHINGDPLDNRLENLREVEPRENCANRVFGWKRTEGKLPGGYDVKDCFLFEVRDKQYKSANAHACFHDLVLLGRMFEAESGDALAVAEETRRTVTEVLATVKDDDKRRIADQVFRFVDYLESVQRMPLLVRFKFFEVVISVYDFLRKNKQLARAVGEFDSQVRNFIRNLLQMSNE